MENHPHPPPPPEQPNYYAIIPATVRYDSELSPAAKLLYAEITALSQITGRCFASNGYFSRLYKVDVSTVSRWIKQLVERGHITTDITYKPNSREIDKRYLQICGGGIGKNAMGGIGKNAMDNNTSINNTSINKSLSDFQKKIAFDDFTPNNLMNESFEKFWMLYAKKIDRENCFRKWHKLSRLDHEAILAHVPRYVASTPDKNFRKNPLSYLNNLGWLNEVIIHKRSQNEPQRRKIETVY